jgi:hypothetical protein
MKSILQLLVLIVGVSTAVAASDKPVFARGGAANIMNSPGYQRRLQESRQQLSRLDVPPHFSNPRKRQRRRRD